MSNLRGLGPPLKQRVPGTTLCVSGVSLSVKKTTLQEHFGEYGRIVRIEAPQGKHVAFIEYDSKRDCNDALEASRGKVIDGQRVTVKLADLRPPGSFEPALPKDAAWEGDNRQAEPVPPVERGERRSPEVVRARSPPAWRRRGSCSSRSRSRAVRAERQNAGGSVEAGGGARDCSRSAHNAPRTARVAAGGPEKGWQQQQQQQEPELGKCPPQPWQALRPEQQKEGQCKPERWVQYEWEQQEASQKASLEPQAQAQRSSSSSSTSSVRSTRFWDKRRGSCTAVKPMANGRRRNAGGKSPCNKRRVHGRSRSTGRAKTNARDRRSSSGSLSRSAPPCSATEQGGCAASQQRQPRAESQWASH
eukprot:CAMPEP_0171106716 /NCGR_PEP_ID=MMETSP0766_2-20121228/65350_1 /TAXON_ID=439317 /ORGANISM="Gambierdiscus australes, Strain CAWD 149" /LENGTH=360 /DNA_ID=CAMNT_0011567875 /DNA_START=58 /DNA_END=1137 /DNA_ORIENTATION=+